MKSAQETFLIIDVEDSCAVFWKLLYIYITLKKKKLVALKNEWIMTTFFVFIASFNLTSLLFIVVSVKDFVLYLYMYFSNRH